MKESSNNGGSILPPNHPLEPMMRATKNRNAITAFLHSNRINNGSNQPITCTLFPRKRDGSAGYLFELSPQVGCIMNCDFCGCGKFKGNLTAVEVVDQIRALEEEALLRNVPMSAPFKIGFSDGGELLLNRHCPDILEAVTSHMPVLVKISTTMPRTPMLRRNLAHLFDFMQNYKPGITLQISLYSTDESIRNRSSSVPFISFAELRDIGEEWKTKHPEGRNITLTFTLTSTSHCDPREIARILPPELFRVRLHPYKPNNIKGIATMPSQDCEELCAAFEECGYTTDLERYQPWENEQLLIGGTLTVNTLLKEEDDLSDPAGDGHVHIIRDLAEEWDMNPDGISTKENQIEDEEDPEPDE